MYHIFLFRKFEERLELCESENLSLRHRVSKLENLNTLPRQSHVRQSGNQRNSDKNSSNIVQKVVVYGQVINIIIESIIMEIGSIYFNIACLFKTYFGNKISL